MMSSFGDGERVCTLKAISYNVVTVTRTADDQTFQIIMQMSYAHAPLHWQRVFLHPLIVGEPDAAGEVAGR